jgi:hypothetical protein
MKRKPQPSTTATATAKKMPIRLQKYINRNRFPEDVKVPMDERFPYEKLKIRGDNRMLFRFTGTGTPIYGVYFICCMGNYREIVAEQMETLRRSGLFRRAEMIYCFICLYHEDIVPILEPYMSKLKIISTVENLYERFALDNFRAHIPPTSSSYYLFYFHTKGVTRDVETMHEFHERRKNLDYFILERHEVCLFWLDHDYDAVGVCFCLYPALHFSGNFWWARSSHLDRLSPTVLSPGYLAPEMYVCGFPDGKYISVCQSTNDVPNTTYVGMTNVEILKQSTCMPIINPACKRLAI